MKKLRFSKDNGSVFYKELCEHLDHYFETNQIPYTGNRVMIFKILMYFGLDILFYSLMITSTTPLSFVVFYLLMGLAVLLTAFNISHDAAHGVAVRSRFWNQVLFQLSFNLQGNNAYVWGKNHTESHHLYTNVSGSDIDVLDNPLVRMTAQQTRRWYHRFQHVYSPFLYLFYSLNWFFFREGLMLFNVSSRTIKIAIPAREVVRLVFFKILYVGYMILLPIYLLPFGAGLVFMTFLLNHIMISLLFVGVLGVSHLSDYVEHPVADAEGKMDMSWPKLQMCTSLDYNAGSRFFNWTLGGFNAHTLHHLLPNICHVHYLDILPIFRALCAKHGLTYMEVSYGQSLRSHFRFLKRMGAHDHFTPTPFAR